MAGEGPGCGGSSADGLTADLVRDRLVVHRFRVDGG
jgi:hypothetical protein